MSDKSDTDPSMQITHLFTVRFWHEDIGSGKKDWRGKVQHVNTGEARYFRDWSTLEEFIEGLLAGNNLVVNPAEGSGEGLSKPQSG